MQYHGGRMAILLQMLASKSDGVYPELDSGMQNTKPTFTPFEILLILPALDLIQG